MDAEMEITITVLWMAGVICGTSFFVGLASFIWNWWKKHRDRLIFSFLAIVIGFIGMSYSLFTILRLFRSWL